MKYRIAKKAKHNGLGQVTNTCFIIQKKYWLGWRNIDLPTLITHYSWGDPLWNGREFSYKTIEFSNFEQAESVITLLLNPFKLKYKGHTIKRLFFNNGRIMYYSTKSKHSFESKGYRYTGYSPHYSIDKIKYEIDESLKRQKGKTVITL